MAYIQLQLRRGTSSEWTSANPVLALGEVGLETNTRLFKIGDGTTAWNSLSYGGLQGVQGTNGTGGQGIQGIQGQSIQGIQGIQGVQGQSIQGIQGVQGQSIQGIQGVQGQSVQGIQGTTGMFSSVSSSTTTSSLSWNSSLYDYYELTSQSGNLTINIDSASSPTNGKRIIFRIRTPSTGGTFTMTQTGTNKFRLVGTSIPNSLTAGNVLYIGGQYNSTDSSWDIIAVKEGLI